MGLQSLGNTGGKFIEVSDTSLPTTGASASKKNLNESLLGTSNKVDDIASQISGITDNRNQLQSPSNELEGRVIPKEKDIRKGEESIVKNVTVKDIVDGGINKTDLAKIAKNYTVGPRGLFNRVFNNATWSRAHDIVKLCAMKPIVLLDNDGNEVKRFLVSNNLKPNDIVLT